MERNSQPSDHVQGIDEHSADLAIHAAASSIEANSKKRGVNDQIDYAGSPDHSAASSIEASSKKRGVNDQIVYEGSPDESAAKRKRSLRFTEAADAPEKDWVAVRGQTVETVSLRAESTKKPPLEARSTIQAAWDDLYSDIVGKPLPEGVPACGASSSYTTAVAEYLIELLRVLTRDEQVTEGQVLRADPVFELLTGAENRADIAPMLERGLAASRQHADAAEGLDASALLYLGYAILREAGYGDDPETGLDLAAAMITVAVRELQPNHDLPQLPEGVGEFLGALTIGLDVKAKMEEASAEGQHELQAFCTAVGDTFLHRAVKLGIVALAGLAAAIPGVGPLISAVLTTFAGNVTETLLQPLPEPVDAENGDVRAYPAGDLDPYDSEWTIAYNDYTEWLRDKTEAELKRLREPYDDQDARKHAYETPEDFEGVFEYEFAPARQPAEPRGRTPDEERELEELQDQPRPKPAEDWQEEEQIGFA